MYYGNHHNTAHFSHKLILYIFYPCVHVLGIVIFWLLGKSKRGAAGAVTQSACANGRHGNTVDAQQNALVSSQDAVNASLLQSNANSVDQIDQEAADPADLNLL